MTTTQTKCQCGKPACPDVKGADLCLPCYNVQAREAMAQRRAEAAERRRSRPARTAPQIGDAGGWVAWGRMSGAVR